MTVTMAGAVKKRTTPQVEQLAIEHHLKPFLEHKLKEDIS